MELDEFIRVAPEALAEFARTVRDNHADDPACAPIEHVSIIDWWEEVVTHFDYALRDSR